MSLVNAINFGVFQAKSLRIANITWVYELEKGHRSEQNRVDVI